MPFEWGRLLPWKWPEEFVQFLVPIDRSDFDNESRALEIRHRAVWRYCWIVVIVICLTGWVWNQAILFYIVLICLTSTALRKFSRINLSDGTAIRCEWTALASLVAVSFSKPILCHPLMVALFDKLGKMDLCGILPRLSAPDWRVFTLLGTAFVISLAMGKVNFEDH
jgi:hypothetical protein